MREKRTKSFQDKSISNLLALEGSQRGSLDPKHFVFKICTLD